MSLMPQFSILDDVSPEDLGFDPVKFPSYRDVQRQAAQWMMYGDEGRGTRRFMAAGIPAGGGKSALAVTLGELSGGKYAIITATKGLENQYVDDCPQLVNVRGRRNYRCYDPDHVGDETWDCERGYEEGCKLCDTGMCSYRLQVERAKEAKGIVTNDMYWMTVRSRNQQALEGEEYGAIRLLIVDEAHKSSDSLSRCVGAWFPNTELHNWADELVRGCVEAAKGAEWGFVEQTWLDALTLMWSGVTERMREIAEWFDSDAAAFRVSKEFRKLSKMAGDLERIVTLGTDRNWIWRLTRSGVAFDCIWPGRYAERYLWTGVEKIVLMSGTLRTKALTMVGLSESKYWFKEWPRQFPAANNPVVWIPRYDATGKVKRSTMGRKATDEDLGIAIERAHEIYDEWAPHWKGLVQTASYRRAEWLQSQSKYGRYMLLNKRGESAGEMLEKFKAAPEPRDTGKPVILVSPSYTTGYDIPMDQSWQHVLKMPFADRSDPVVQARCESDPDWYDYDVGQVFQQSTARTVRKKTHKATIMVTDDAIGRFRNYAGQKHWSSWFRVQEVRGVPRAPR